MRRQPSLVLILFATCCCAFRGQAQEVWTRVATPTPSTLSGATWGADQFVVVGESGTIITSPDGSTWISQNSSTTKSLTAVAFAAECFVAVGAEGTILTSADGATWTPRISGTTEQLNAIAYGNRRWVAAGDRGTLLYSFDGANWKTHESPSGRVSDSSLRGLAYGYGGFIATGRNGIIVSTADGAHLHRVSHVPTAFLEGITHGRRRFVSVGDDRLVMTSADGYSWRGHHAPAPMQAVAFFNHVFVGVTADGGVLTSADGTTWISRATVNSAPLFGIAAGPDSAIAVGASGAVLRAGADPSAPVVAIPPASVTDAAGATIRLEVIATGRSPLQYQWAFNGTALSGATSDTLVVERATAADAGQYSVTITNQFGTATSLPAALTVLPAPLPLGEIVDAGFTTSAPPVAPLALLELPDRRVLAAGAQGWLVRLNPDGTRDPTFTADAIPSSVTIQSLVLQPDGRILVGGGTEPTPRTAGRYLVRLQPDGSIDPSFVPSAELPGDTIRQLLSQPDGRILVANGSLRLYRLNADGSIDPTFGALPIPALSESNPEDRIRPTMLALTADGRIYVAGPNVTERQGLIPLGSSFLARLLPTGARDSAFPSILAGNQTVRLIAPQPDGSVIYASERNLPLMGGGGWSLRRFLPNGAVDPTFVVQAGGFGRYGGQIRAALDREGNIVLARSQGAPYAWEIGRYRPDGTDTQTLAAPEGDRRFAPLTALAALADGGTLVAGHPAGYSHPPRLDRLAVRNIALPANPPSWVGTANPPALALAGGDSPVLRAVFAGSNPLSITWEGWNSDSARTFPNPATRNAPTLTDGLLVVENIRLDSVYYPIARNAAGVSAGPPRVIAVAARAPAFVRQPVSVTTNQRRFVRFDAEVLGSGPLTYEWLHDGRSSNYPPTFAGLGPIRFETYATSDNVGTYQLVVRNDHGMAISEPVTLTIDDRARLANVSTRGFAGAGEQALIAGFIISGDRPKHVLVRGLGPALSTYGVESPLADPKLSLFDRAGSLIAENDNLPDERAEDTHTRNYYGAFVLPRGSRDAVILAELAPGSYTAHVTGVGGATGTALVEIYEDRLEAARLMNVSSRVQVGPGDRVAIPGIILDGSAPRRVLLRAIGPTLGQFGVTTPLADPRLTLLDQSGQAVVINDDWSSAGAADIAAAAMQVGAFPLAADSRDAATLVTLPAGAYTALVSGADNETGTVLVEVFEVP